MMAEYNGSELLLLIESAYDVSLSLDEVLRRISHCLSHHLEAYQPQALLDEKRDHDAVEAYPSFQMLVRNDTKPQSNQLFNLMNVVLNTKYYHANLLLKGYIYDSLDQQSLDTCCKNLQTLTETFQGIIWVYHANQTAQPPHQSQENDEDIKRPHEVPKSYSSLYEHFFVSCQQSNETDNSVKSLFQSILQSIPLKTFLHIHPSNIEINAVKEVCLDMDMEYIGIESSSFERVLNIPSPLVEIHNCLQAANQVQKKISEHPLPVSEAFKRVADSLSCHMWPNMIRKPNPLTLTSEKKIAKISTSNQEAQIEKEFDEYEEVLSQMIHIRECAKKANDEDRRTNAEHALSKLMQLLHIEDEESDDSNASTVEA